MILSLYVFKYLFIYLFIFIDILIPETTSYCFSLVLPAAIIPWWLSKPQRTWRFLYFNWINGAFFPLLVWPLRLLPGNCYSLTFLSTQDTHKPWNSHRRKTVPGNCSDAGGSSSLGHVVPAVHPHLRGDEHVTAAHQNPNKQVQTGLLKLLEIFSPTFEYSVWQFIRRCPATRRCCRLLNIGDVWGQGGISKIISLVSVGLFWKIPAFLENCSYKTLNGFKTSDSRL